MNLPKIDRNLFTLWSEEDLRSHYEFLLEREDRLTSRQQLAFDIVSEILIEREAAEMAASESAK